jgi:hypothetical protein
MGYNTGNGRWANTIPLTLANSTITATTVGAAVELGDRTTLRLDAVVATATGTTPSLTITIETSKDATTWTTVAAFTAITAAGSARKIFTGLDRFIRINETVSGTTPSFVRTISGEAV